MSQVHIWYQVIILQLQHNHLVVMALLVSPASIDEVDRIAEIHLAAFDSNPLLHVQFPTSSSLRTLKHTLAQEMRCSIEAGDASGKSVLVVKDHTANNLIISFAKWEFPTPLAHVRSSESTSNSDFRLILLHHVVHFSGNFSLTLNCTSMNLQLK